MLADTVRSCERIRPATTAGVHRHHLEFLAQALEKRVKRREAVADRTREEDGRAAGTVAVPDDPPTVAVHRERAVELVPGERFFLLADTRGERSLVVGVRALEVVLRSAEVAELQTCRSCGLAEVSFERARVIGEAAEAGFKASARLEQGVPPPRPDAGRQPVGRRFAGPRARGQMKSHDLGLARRREGHRGQRRCDATVDLPSPGLEQALVGRIAKQRVSEPEAGFGLHPRAHQNAACDQPADGSVQLRRRVVRDGREQVAFELAAEARGQLGDGPPFRILVEPSEEGSLEAPRDRGSRTCRLGLEDRPAQLLEEERHALAARQDLRLHGRIEPASLDQSADNGRGGRPIEPVELEPDEVG